MSDQTTMDPGDSERERLLHQVRHQQKQLEETTEALALMKEIAAQAQRERDQWERKALSAGEHPAVVAARRELDELREQRDELTRYIDDAKKACGDDRVTGEPLAQVIASLRSQLAEVTKERDEIRSVWCPAHRKPARFEESPCPSCDQHQLEQTQALLDHRTQASVRLADDLSAARAALAASEEKARGMREALERICDGLADEDEDFIGQIHEIAGRALSSPSAGPASEGPTP